MNVYLCCVKEIKYDGEIDKFHYSRARPLVGVSIRRWLYGCKKAVRTSLCALKKFICNYSTTAHPTFFSFFFFISAEKRMRKISNLKMKEHYRIKSWIGPSHAMIMMLMSHLHMKRKQKKNNIEKKMANAFISTCRTIEMEEYKNQKKKKNIGMHEHDNIERSNRNDIEMVNGERER